MEGEDTNQGRWPVTINASRCGSISINITYQINIADDPGLRELCRQLLTEGAIDREGEA